MQRILSVFFAALLLALVPLASVSANTYAPPLKGEMIRLKVISNPSDTMPNILFDLPDGKSKYLHDFKGSIVVLNMWATWCPPCVKELPSLNALQRSMDPSYVKVLAVSVDPKGETATSEFLTNHNLDQLEPFVDKNEVLMRLEQLRGAAGIPITMIIDPQSRLLAVYNGDADWNGADARAVIDYYRNKVSFVPFSFGSMGAFSQ